MLVVLVCLAGTWGVVQWQRVPAYWEARAQVVQNPVAADSAASDLERRLVRQVSQIGRDADTATATETITIDFYQANAWLKMKLKAWALHQDITIPAPLKDIIIALEGDQLVVGFALETPEIEQVFSVNFDVRILPSGEAVVEVTGVRAGRLPIPISAVLKHLRKSVPSEAIDPVAKLLAGDPFDPVTAHPGNDGQRLRVVGFDADHRGIAITFAAEAR